MKIAIGKSLLYELDTTMSALLLRPRKRYSASEVSLFAVKEICAIVSSMSLVAENNAQASQSESAKLNARLEILLSKISNQDKAAFEQFYDSTIKRCFSQALRTTDKQNIAEEVIGDVYMQVWNKAMSYDKNRSGVMTWLMMLCRSRALDALRRCKNQREKESIDIESIVEPASDDNPQDMLNALQQNSLLHDAMRQLKPQSRQLLSLAYFKGFTHAEISSYTELPLGTVKTQIRRAIIMLKELMNEQGARIKSRSDDAEKQS